MGNQNLFPLTPLVGLRWIEMKIIQIQRGVTLIEMMIAMVLGLFVTGAIITVFVSNVISTTDNVRMIQLNQELRASLAFISDEMKRAGYSSDSDSTYMDTLAAFDDDGDGLNDCFIYAYDSNSSGGAVTAAETFGFRLENNELFWGNNATNACNFGDELTDSAIASITAFTLTFNAVTAGAVNVNQLDVTITGQVNLNSLTAVRTLTETIRIRNDDT